MFDDLKLRSSAHDLLRYSASVFALLLICAPFTIGAIWAFPIWDDAAAWLLLKEKGVGAIVANAPDRPLRASLLSLVATSEHAYWLTAFIAQALLWPIFGVIAALLWCHLFPNLRRYAVVVGCLTVAPFVTKVQMLTSSIAVGGLLSVVLGYGAILLSLRFVEANNRLGRVGLALGLSMLASAILLSEYALPVVIVMLVLLLPYVWIVSDRAAKARAWRVILLSTITASGAYATYFLLADHGARPNVHPFQVFTLGEHHLVRLPFRLVSAIWQGVVGGFATSLGQVALTSRLQVAGAAYGALVAGLLVCGSRDQRQSSSRVRNGSDKTGVFVLVLALAAGLMPVFMMGRIPWDPGDGMSSRFGLPVLPIAAALTVFMGLSFVRRRSWVVPIILFGFAAGNASLTEAWSAITERQTMSALGAVLRAHVSTTGGYTVAVVPLPERTMGPRRQWELTARIAATWPPELRSKFWAYRFGGGPPLHYKEDATEIFGPRTSCKPPHYIEAKVRLVTRRGHLDRLLWVVAQADGSISVEPYCTGIQNTGQEATVQPLPALDALSAADR